jgi:hypothetical protein
MNILVTGSTGTIGSLVVGGGGAAGARPRAPHLRDLAMQRVGQLGPNATSDDLIAMSRRLHDAT